MLCLYKCLLYKTIEYNSVKKEKVWIEHVLLFNGRLLLLVSQNKQTKMANRTVKDAHSIKGTNPQYLVEKIIRTRIYECKYWKEECFALTGTFYLVCYSLYKNFNTFKTYYR